MLPKRVNAATAAIPDEDEGPPIATKARSRSKSKARRAEGEDDEIAVERTQAIELNPDDWRGLLYAANARPCAETDAWSEQRAFARIKEIAPAKALTLARNLHVCLEGVPVPPAKSSALIFQFIEYTLVGEGFARCGTKPPPQLAQRIVRARLWKPATNTAQLLFAAEEAAGLTTTKDILGDKQMAGGRKRNIAVELRGKYLMLHDDWGNFRRRERPGSAAAAKNARIKQGMSVVEYLEGGGTVPHIKTLEANGELEIVTAERYAEEMNG